MELIIGWLYPDIMSTYGDRGNIICLKKRSQWRGIKTEILQITLETKPSMLENCNLLFMGGAQDQQQKIASDDLITHKGPILKKMISIGIPGLFVCAAYQFLGKYYQMENGEKIKGLGIFDLFTKHPGNGKPRCIGNTIAVLKGIPGLNYNIVGFENHGGRTYLNNKTTPLAKIIKGFGNNGEDESEGAVCNNAYGTYFHGPVLPKNLKFADHLIKLALCIKYQKDIELPTLNDKIEELAHNYIIKKYI